MSKTLHVKKGDRVRVIAGKDKGLVGEVLKVDVAAERVVVSGVNIVKRDKRDSAPQPQSGQVTKGGIISSEAPIHVSNVMVVDSDGNPTRVGYRTDEETGKRVRISRKNGKDI